MKLKNKIFTSLILIVSYIFYGTITYGDHSLMLVMLLTTNYFLSVKIFKNNTLNDSFKKIIILISPILIVFITIIILYNQFSRTILYIIFLPISSALAYTYFKFENKIILLFSIFTFWVVGYILFENVLILVENKNAETNIRFPEIKFTDENKSIVNFNKNKIIVLDFWTTTCSICFTKFPDLESTYLKYKKNPKVIIYAVNVPLRNDSFNKTTKILNNLGYTFPKIYASSAKHIEDSLKINSFPHMIILKDGRIRYSGLFESEKKVAFYNIESEIQKLLVEK